MTLTKRIILANVGMAAICAASTMAQEAVTPQPVPAAQPPVVSAPLHFPAGPKWSSPEIAKVGDMLKGTWKSTAAVPGRDGASEAEIVMTVAPIVAQDIPDAMYVESARSDSMQAPYRRSLFQLYSYKGHVRLRTLEPITPEGRDTLNQLTGFWAYPEALPLLTSHAVKSADYIATLDVELEPFKQGGGFSGKTPYPYPNGANGAVEMTSELTLMPDALTSADRGYDASGKVVWGAAEKDKYTFTRYNPPLPSVDKREDGLVLLWYKKVVEGETLNESMRYYAQYTGWLAGGGQLDTSRGRDKAGGPFGFVQIPQVALGTIRAWKEALKGVGLGSTVRMLVPPELGYGAKPITRGGKTVAPPDSPLVFEIEVVGIEPAKKPEPTALPDGIKIVPNKGGGQGGRSPK